MNQDIHKNASPPLHAQSESWPLSRTGFNTDGVKMWEVETVVLSLIPLSHYVTCITEFKWASAPSWEGKPCPVFCSPITSGLSLQKDLIGGMYWSTKKKEEEEDVSHTEKWWIYEGSCLPGCTVSPCTRVSCKLSWWFYFLVFHVLYCRMCSCSAGRVITCKY